MEEAQRLVGVRELDLANYGPVSVVDRINVVQGLRTSAGKSFLLLSFNFHFIISSFIFIFSCTTSENEKFCALYTFTMSSNGSNFSLLMSPTIFVSFLV